MCERVFVSQEQNKHGDLESVMHTAIKDYCEKGEHNTTCRDANMSKSLEYMKVMNEI
jgi:hypothetical protein